MDTRPQQIQCYTCIKHTHTHTQQFNGLLCGTTRVGRYQKKHSPTHTHPDDRTSFIIFLHLQRSKASSLFSLWAWQSSRTTSRQVLFGLPLGLGPSTSYPSISSPNHASSSKRQINITCEVTCTECLKQKNSKHEKLEAKMCTTYLQNAANEYKN